MFLFGEERGVAGDEFLLLLGQVLHWLNGIRSAHGHAGAAVNAALRIHIELGCGLKLGFVLLGMNAVRGTHVHAQFVFNAAAGNYVSHMN